MIKTSARNALASLVLLCSLLHAKAEATKPNVLLVVVDDWGWRDAACYGSKFYETPQIDRFAASAVKFNQAYSAYPRCVPSRFGLLTGKHPAGFQGTGDGTKVLPERDRTIGTAFQTAGYTTFYCGKWHLGEGASAPSANGFSETYAAGAAGAARSHFAPFNKGRGKAGEEKDLIPDVDEVPEGTYLTDHLTERTIDFMTRHKDRPFFAVLAHYAVHTPIEGKPDATAYFREKAELRESNDPAWEKESAGENALVQKHPGYAAMVRSVDESVGRLLETLAKLGIEKNTIVVLTSDHGGLSARGNQREVATSNRPLRGGKGHLYEGGIRVPLVVLWPGTSTPATEIEAPVFGTDIFPTLLEMAGLPTASAPSGEGQSVAQLLKGGPIDERPLFWHNPAARPKSTGDLFSSAVREGRWKLLEFPTENKVELYDLTADVGEGHNLAEKNPVETTRLQKLLADWKQRVSAAAPGDKRGKRAASTEAPAP